MSKSQVAKPNYVRGALFALLGIVVGVAAWVLLWEFGFIASIATFAMAWCVVRLYGMGAGSIDKKSLYIIIGYIALGMILSILAGMIADGVTYAMHESKADAFAVLSSGDFWSFITYNLLHNGELWYSYKVDILISLGLGALGVYGTVKDVLAHGRISTEAKASKQ